MRISRMHRHIVLAVAAITLAVPARSSAQTTTEREREREQQRIEREREKAQEARDREQGRRDREREREQERRDREQERRERERERERNAAGALDTTVAFDAKGSVTVTCPGGTVVITGADRNEIKVKARTENGAIRFVSNGIRATLEPSSGRGCSDGRFEVTVPVGARVSARSWSGSVSVRGVHGDVETQTQSADIDVRDVGRLDLETLSGDVTIQGVKGDAMIHTVSGDVDLTNVQGGDVEVETVSGDLQLRDIEAKQVRTHTTSGDVEFVGKILDGGRYEFTTHSGEVRLQLPADVGAQLSVSTFSGVIDSDFPITLKSGDHGIGAAQSKRLNFTLGQGTARIIAETFSGNVTLSSTGRRR
jgi:DUF4097 and DUF4098 domain-containing protein YvlB